MFNFNDAKRFVRKHKYEFIIGGVVIALTGAFLAFFVDLAFLAMVFLSFIWIGYFYFLGTEDQSDENKTNDNQNKNKLEIDLSVNKDIKLKNDQKLPEYQVQTQEDIIINGNNKIQGSQKLPEYQMQKQEDIVINGNNNIQKSQKFPEHQPQAQENVIVNGNDNIQESKVDSPCVPITEELVYGYISEMITIGWVASLGQESQLVTTRDASIRPKTPIYCVLTLHFQKIRWQTYSLDQIIFDVKSIIGILTDTAINDIDEYLNRYLENPTNDNNSTNIYLITTKNVEEQLKEFDHRYRRSICIEELDNLIKKIESRYQAAINKLENPSPNIEVAPQLNDIK